MHECRSRQLGREYQIRAKIPVLAVAQSLSIAAATPLDLASKYGQLVKPSIDLDLPHRVEDDLRRLPSLCCTAAWLPRQP